MTSGDTSKGYWQMRREIKRQCRLALSPTFRGDWLEPFMNLAYFDADCDIIGAPNFRWPLVRDAIEQVNRTAAALRRAGKPCREIPPKSVLERRLMEWAPYEPYEDPGHA